MKRIVAAVDSKTGTVTASSVEVSSTSKKRKKHPFVKTIIILVLFVGFILYNWNIAGIRHKVWVQEAKWYVKIHQKDLERDS